MQPNQLRVRRFDLSADYEDVSSWWKEHKWEPIHPDFLPQTGYIVEDDKVKHCAAWLYMNGTKLGTFEWLVTNPRAPIKKKKEAIGAILDFGKTLFQSMGVTAVWTALKNENLMKIYEGYGFQKTDEQMTHFIARL